MTGGGERGRRCGINDGHVAGPQRDGGRYPIFSNDLNKIGCNRYKSLAPNQRQGNYWLSITIQQVKVAKGSVKMFRGTATLVAGLILLAGCTMPTQQPVAVDGSKSDATVTMAAEYSPNGTLPNWTTADQAALERCEAWGYTGAEPLGAKFSSCAQLGAYGSCARTRETVTYQCLGGTTIRSQ